MRALVFVLALLLPGGALWAHEEILRTDLGELAEGADWVGVGRVVQVFADRGSRGPRWVTIVVERVLEGPPAGALTFRAPVEHGPGWQVGESAAFFLRRDGDGWRAAALAAESPRVEPGGAGAFAVRWSEVTAPRRPSLPGMLGGAAVLAGLLWGWRRRWRPEPA